MYSMLERNDVFFLLSLQAVTHYIMRAKKQKNRLSLRTRLLTLSQGKNCENLIKAFCGGKQIRRAISRDLRFRESNAKNIDRRNDHCVDYRQSQNKFACLTTLSS